MSELENRSRPKTEEELNAILREAYDHACKSNYSQALEICNWLLDDPSTETAALRERSSVREHMNDWDGAIDDLQLVVQKVAVEPADFHALGLLMLQQRTASEAEQCFTQAIELSKKLRNTYYTNSARLLRAESRLRQGDYLKSIDDCKALPSGYSVYVSGSGMRNREDIEAEAQRQLNKR